MASDGAAGFRQPTSQFTMVLAPVASEFVVVRFVGEPSVDLEPDKIRIMLIAGMDAAGSAMRYTLDVSRPAV